MNKDKTEFEKFRDMAKVIVKAPKSKKRKPKAKPKKTKKEGGKYSLCVKYVIAISY